MVASIVFTFTVKFATRTRQQTDGRRNDTTTTVRRAVHSQVCDAVFSVPHSCHLDSCKKKSPRSLSAEAELLTDLRHTTANRRDPRMEKTAPEQTHAPHGIGNRNEFRICHIEHRTGAMTGAVIKRARRRPYPVRTGTRQYQDHVSNTSKLSPVLSLSLTKVKYKLQQQVTSHTSHNDSPPPTAAHLRPHAHRIPLSSTGDGASSRRHAHNSRTSARQNEIRKPATRTLMPAVVPQRLHDGSGETHAACFPHPVDRISVLQLR